MSKEGLYYYTKDEIDELISGGGSSSSIFMTKAVYDTDDNGIVDNAEKVNGKTVQSDVPANAKFTDTTYTAGTGIEINNGVISCKFASMPQGTSFYGSTSDLYNFLSTLDMSATATRTDFSNMFNNCTALTRVPLFDTHSATTVFSMFANCSALISVPQFDLSNATNCADMFVNCTSLTTISQLDTAEATNMNYMFKNCTSLATAPLLDMSKVQTASYIFAGCTSLRKVPHYDMSECTDPGAMFNGCSALATVPQFDWSSVTSFGGALSSTHMFDGCTSLSNESLNNILASLTSATSYSGGLLTPKTLKFIGLTQAQATICEGLSNFAAFTAAGWSTGY